MTAPVAIEPLPVIPVALHGTREIWPADERLLRPGRISIGRSIRPRDGGWKEIVCLRDATRGEIIRRCEGRRERAHGNP